MRNPSLPLKIALVFSLSVAVSSSSSSSHFFFSRPSFSLKSSSSSSAKSTAADLLSVLGSREQAASINRKRADDLRSCLRFLVPFCPNNNSIRRSVVIGGEEDGRRRWSEREENEMVWRPPEPVLELARLAVDSAGDPDAIYRALDPTVIPVPHVDGYGEDKCELTRTPYGRRFINQELNSYLAFLFEMIAARGPSAGLNVSLSRYDLFHGHLFLATDSGRLGILFHAKEYPAYEKEVFPYNMGYCQRGSNVIYDDEMNLRNILWLAPLPCNVTKAWVAPENCTFNSCLPPTNSYVSCNPKLGTKSRYVLFCCGFKSLTEVHSYIIWGSICLNLSSQLIHLTRFENLMGDGWSLMKNCSDVINSLLVWIVGA